MFNLESVILRKLEIDDIEAFYVYKNDPEVISSLGGFSLGYSKRDLTQWLDYHASQDNEFLLTIADADNFAIGHMGLYKIDYRIGVAEFAIMIGKKELWGHGIGKECTQWMIQYAFENLNLRRIYLEVLETNSKAQKLYESVGFRLEGRLRKAQYKQGQYVDVLIMALLKDDTV